MFVNTIDTFTPTCEAAALNCSTGEPVSRATPEEAEEEKIRFVARNMENLLCRAVVTVPEGLFSAYARTGWAK
jgi:hypothetical protein